MKRVLVALGGQLLAAALESMLLREQQLNIVTSPSTERSDLLAHIAAYQPNVVILEAGTVDNELLCIISLMKDCPNLSIVTVSSESNQVHLYAKKVIQITQSTDLISTILAT